MMLLLLLMLFQTSIAIDLRCPELKEPKNGEVSCTDNRRGEKECVGHCFPGYYFADSKTHEIRLTCRGRRWEPMRSFPICESEGYCDIHIEEDKGTYNCTVGMDGKACDIFCDEPPRLSGRYYCTPDTSWTPALPHCVQTKESVSHSHSHRATNCPDPGQIWNGRRSNNSPTSTRLFPVGSDVKYSCLRNYELVGQSTLVCGSDGEWSHPKPICAREPSRVPPPETRKRTCPDPGFVQNGIRLDSDGRPSPHSKTYEEGAVVAFSCRDGYSLEGQSFLNMNFSLLNCLSSGQWSQSPPRCNRNSWISTASQITQPPKDGHDRPKEPVYCVDPGEIADGQRMNIPDIDYDLDTKYPEGSEIKFSCDEGFALKGSESTKCLSTGIWSSSNPTCEIISRPDGSHNHDDKQYCADPGSIANGKRMFYPMNAHKRYGEGAVEYPAGVHIDYFCDDEYDLVGQAHITCLDTGEWSDSVPECQGNHEEVDYCTDPGYVTNSERILVIPVNMRKRLNREGVVEYPSGSHIDYSCKQGYDLIGEATLICFEGGTWSSNRKPDCRESCGRSFSNNPAKLSHGHRTVANAFPWQVAIADVDRYGRTNINCGGVLINRRTVLTTARCVSGRNLEKTMLYFGKYFSNNRNDGHQHHHVVGVKPQYFTVHPRYTNCSIDSDIAVIRIASLQMNSRISPVCLPTRNSTRKNLQPGSKGIITGRVSTDSPGYPEVLMMDQVKVVSSSTCQAQKHQPRRAQPNRTNQRVSSCGQRHEITRNMFCAGYEDQGVDSCFGDNGGPVTFYDEGSNKWTVEGLVSFGVENSECGDAGQYVVYTRVASMMRWLIEKM